MVGTKRRDTDLQGFGKGLSGQLVFLSLVVESAQAVIHVL